MHGFDLQLAPEWHLWAIVGAIALLIFATGVGVGAWLF